MENQSQKITALLGPTNTGKTFVAIEKMLSYESGIFGLINWIWRSTIACW